MKHHAFTPRLLPASAAAHYLGVSESTLRGLEIARVTIGAKRLYDVVALDNFVAGLDVEGEASEWDMEPKA